MKCIKIHMSKNWIKNYKENVRCHIKIDKKVNNLSFYIKKILTMSGFHIDEYLINALHIHRSEIEQEKKIPTSEL